jgi:enoyl-CoA hydratase/carnithine racemase
MSGGASSPGRVRLEVDGPVAVITNDNPAKKNAFDDAMDAQLFEILGELATRRDVRAVIWRGEGTAWSSGRDVSAIGGGQVELSHHQLMSRGHQGILRLFEIEAPVIVAIQGWAIGGSFQRALLCDIRIAAQGARFRLPELTHGVIPDTGGVARLYQMCGHGVVSDMVLTGRVMDAEEALAHGVVSRVVPPDALDETARQMADAIAGFSPTAVSTARRVIRHLGEPSLRASMEDELIGQTFVVSSDDFAEQRAARAEGRAPRYPGR